MTRMGKERLAAFSDGVLAIIITIMVLELRAPHDATPAALLPLWPVFLSYTLSFIYIAIYWNNHHHMIHTVKRVNGAVLWANMNLLFWLSLIPFATAWLGENHFQTWPAAVYGVSLLMPAIAYYILERVIICADGPANSLLADAVGRDAKGLASVVLYASGIGLAFISAKISCAIYVGVALLWLVPDRRIEKKARG
jgi:uncharacterized membrane protein